MSHFNCSAEFKEAGRAWRKRLRKSAVPARPYSARAESGRFDVPAPGVVVGVFCCPRMPASHPLDRSVSVGASVPKEKK